MKRIISTLLAIILSFSASFAFASNIDVVIDGNIANFKNNTFISQNRVFVPMRDLFETIGATVSWDDSTKCATANLGNKTISFKIGSNIVTENGKTHISDAKCMLVDGKTFIPLRIILELLNFTVNWNDEQNKVEIETPPSDDSGAGENNTPDSGGNISSASEFELEVLNLVNIERKNNGLSALVWDEDLASVARSHSVDMAKRSFFSHTNPDGKSPFDRLKSFGISYRRAAENIAAGQTTPKEVVTSWMNSSGHRANILNGSFTKLGIGYHKSNSGYRHYWTQCFTD